MEAGIPDFKKRIRSRLPKDGSLNLKTLTPDQLVGYISFDAASPDIQDIIIDRCGYNMCTTLPGFELFNVTFLSGLADTIGDYIRTYTALSDVSTAQTADLAEFFTFLQDDPSVMDDSTWWSWYIDSSSNVIPVIPALVLPTNPVTSPDTTTILITLFQGVNSYMNSTLRPSTFQNSYLIHEMRQILISPTKSIADFDTFVNECKEVDPMFATACGIVSSTNQTLTMSTQSAPNYAIFQRKAVFSFTGLKSVISTYITTHSTAVATSSPPFALLLSTFQGITDSHTGTWVSWVALLQPYMTMTTTPVPATRTPPTQLTKATADIMIRNAFCKELTCDSYGDHATALRHDLSSSATYLQLLSDCNSAKIKIAAITICLVILLHRRLNPPLAYTTRILAIMLLVAIVVLFINKYTSMLI